MPSEITKRNAGPQYTQFDFSIILKLLYQGTAMISCGLSRFINPALLKQFAVPPCTSARRISELMMEKSN